MTTTALVLHLDGHITEVNLAADTEVNLATMRQAIGCRLVDVVALTNRLDMWIDDEGLYNYPVNSVATALARRFGCTHQPYHGPVLLCAVDADGNSVDLLRHQVLALLAALDDTAN